MNSLKEKIEKVTNHKVSSISKNLAKYGNELFFVELENKSKLVVKGFPNYRISNFKNELLAERLLRKNRKFTIPQIINKFNLNKKKYLIQQRLEGKLAKGFIKNNPKKLRKITKNLASVLKEIHSHKPKKKLEWKSYLYTKYKPYLNYLFSNKKISKRTLNKINKLIIHKDIPKSAPSLIWGDAHYMNILIKNNKIFGIFDFENSCYGDPIFDIGNFESFYIMDGKRFLSLRGYYQELTNKRLTKKENYLIDIYGLLTAIESSTLFLKYKPNLAKKYGLKVIDYYLKNLKL